jgi:hypothetical protein
MGRVGPLGADTSDLDLLGKLIVDRFSGLLATIERDGMSGFLSRTMARSMVMRRGPTSFNLEADQIAAAQLAVDR